MYLPSTFWAVYGDSSHLGVISVGDPIDNGDEAFRVFCHHTRDGAQARVFQYSMDVETNALEAVSEVTEMFQLRKGAAA